MSFAEVFSYEAFVHAVSGTVGGSVAMTLFYPLDLIRTLNQVDSKTSIVKKIQEEGIGVLYKGLYGVLVSLGVSNFVYFYTNNLLKVFLRRFTGVKDVTVFQNLFVASLAGVVNVLLTCPLWVANTRLKMQSGAPAHGHGAAKANVTSESKKVEKPYTGMIDCMTRIAKEEGVHSLWNGMSSSLMLVSNPTIHWVVYDKVKIAVSERALALGRKNLTSFEIFMTGAIAKALATIFTYPIQVAQSRQRANRDKSGGTFANTFKILSDIYGKEGFIGWFAGMTTKLVQTILTAAFQFLCYEQIQRTIFRIMGKPTGH